MEWNERDHEMLKKLCFKFDLHSEAYHDMDEVVVLQILSRMCVSPESKDNLCTLSCFTQV